MQAFFNRNNEHRNKNLKDFVYKQQNRHEAFVVSLTCTEGMNGSRT